MSTMSNLDQRSVIYTILTYLFKLEVFARQFQSNNLQPYQKRTLYGYLQPINTRHPCYKGRAHESRRKDVGPAAWAHERNMSGCKNKIDLKMSKFYGLIENLATLNSYQSSSLSTIYTCSPPQIGKMWFKLGFDLSSLVNKYINLQCLYKTAFHIRCMVLGMYHIQRIAYVILTAHGMYAGAL